MARVVQTGDRRIRGGLRRLDVDDAVPVIVSGRLMGVAMKAVMARRGGVGLRGGSRRFATDRGGTVPVPRHRAAVQNERRQGRQHEAGGQPA